MTSSEGGVYSAEDADSEGEEGKFYVWTVGEIEELVGAEDTELLSDVYNLSRDGNFTDEATGRAKRQEYISPERTIGRHCGAARRF